MLYTAIGVAGWRLATRGGGRVVLSLHTVQLMANAVWPSVFFSARDRRVAFGLIAALDALVAAEVALAARQDVPAAALLTPYLAWSAYATALTAAVSDPARV